MSHQRAFQTQNANRELRAWQDTARRAEEEAAALRQQVDAFQEREARERQRRAQQWQEQAAHEARSADTWPEALRKYKTILQAEIKEFTGYGDCPDLVIDLETKLSAVTRAITLWQAAEQNAAAEVERLRRRIAEIQASFRSTVALQLQDEFPGCDLSQAIMESDPEDFLQDL
ncbi:MAG: hypothetical protein JST84_05230 [Acidobacteria bacterium]|nr:hypothetical protein [Acidobacteriota bacterium]